MDYGELISNDWKIIELYSLINRYYDNPTMVKTSDKEEYSIYMCRLYSLLKVQKRCIIAVVYKDDNPQGHQLPLKNFKWLSFQIRVFNDIPNTLPQHKYSIKRTDNYKLQIQQSSTDSNAAYYNCEDFPITITLLYTKDKRRYNNTGNLVSALETFNTIITFK